MNDLEQKNRILQSASKVQDERILFFEAPYASMCPLFFVFKVRFSVPNFDENSISIGLLSTLAIFISIGTREEKLIDFLHPLNFCISIEII